MDDQHAKSAQRSVDPANPGHPPAKRRPRRKIEPSSPPKPTPRAKRPRRKIHSSSPPKPAARAMRPRRKILSSDPPVQVLPSSSSEPGSAVGEDLIEEDYQPPTREFVLKKLEDARKLADDILSRKRRQIEYELPDNLLRMRREEMLHWQRSREIKVESDIIWEAMRESSRLGDDEKRKELGSQFFKALGDEADEKSKALQMREEFEQNVIKGIADGLKF